jgi:hypothetical protein
MKRPLPASKVLAPNASEPKLPPCNYGKRSQPIAAELNAQRERPVYDEFRKRRDYKP